MQMYGLERFLVASVAALAVGAALLLAPHSAFACGGSSAVEAGSDRRDFTLVNRSQETIRSVYVERSERRSSCRSDILGGDVLPPGRQLNIRFGGDASVETCRYDIRIVTTSGGDWVRYGADLCSTTTVTFE